MFAEDGGLKGRLVSTFCLGFLIHHVEIEALYDARRQLDGTLAMYSDDWPPTSSTVTGFG